MGNACMSEEDSTKVTYRVEIKTSNAYRSAGTDSSVYIDLVGESGENTGWVKMDTSFWDDFERGSKCVYKRQLVNIGLPIAIRLKLKDKLMEDEWLCEYVIVSLGGDRVEFIVHDWVENDEVEVTRGASLLQTLPDTGRGEILKTMRLNEIERNRRRFQWMAPTSPGDAEWGLPRCANAKMASELPLIFQREWSKVTETEQRERKALAHRISSKVMTAFKPLSSLDEYTQFENFDDGKQGKPPPIDILLSEKSWEDDEVMGYNMLTGACPLALSRCDSIPEYFNVTEDDVVALLRPGKSLSEEMETGRMYIADYSHLKDMERRDGMICCNSIGLFYTNLQNHLVPLAIQLVPGDRDYLFTASDDKDDWMLAKMHFRCTFANVHQWVYRYFHTQAVMEPFATSLFRCLPRAHPVFKLLRPHLWTVMSANSTSKSQLIADDSPGSQAFALSPTPLLRKCFENFRFEDLHIPKVLERKGVDDAVKLPALYYRQDALSTWNILHDFVNDIVTYFYESDTHVAEDLELQNWAQDVAREGFGWVNGDTKGVPEEINDIEQLVDVCTILMFTCTVQHSAVTTGQRDMYGFVPSCPGTMRLPPHKKGEANMDLIMSSLPDVDMSLNMMTVLSVAAINPSQESLLHFPKNYFKDEDELIKAQERFDENLKVCERTIKRRNKNNQLPYVCLRPSRISVNIST